MKKNLIALAVAGAMVAPAVASAADVTLFGDARVRYTMMDSTEKDPLAGNTTYEGAATTSRIRVGFKATEGNTMVTARMKATNGTHGDDVAAGDGNVDVDYGYMSTKIAGMLDVAGGIMVGNWGNKLLFWDTRPNRVLLSTSMINNVWLGLAFDKGVENYEGVAPDLSGNWAGDDDASSMKLLVKAKIAGGHNVGLLYADDENNTAAGTTADVSGNILDIYYNGKVGPVALGVEYYTKSGKQYEVSDTGTLSKADPTALMLTAGMPVGPVSLTAMYVNLEDGGSATNYVDPVSTVGTNQDTALIDLTSAAEAGSSLEVMGVLAGMAVTDAISVQAGLAVATASSGLVGDKDTDISIMDLQATYKVDANTAIRASYGTLDTDDTNTYGVDSDNTVMGIRMQTSF